MEELCILCFKDNLPFVCGGWLQFIDCKEDALLSGFGALCPKWQHQSCSSLAILSLVKGVSSKCDAFVHFGTVIALAWLNICLWYPFKKTLVTLSCAVRGGAADCGGNFVVFPAHATEWLQPRKDEPGAVIRQQIYFGMLHKYITAGGGGLAC